MLVRHKDNEKEKREAVKIMEDVQVETYGSMEKREKMEFILYLMKMLLELNDYVKFMISSRKMSRKLLEDPDVQDLKIVYYSYMIRYYLHEGQHADAAEAYKQIFETLFKGKNEGEKVLDFGFKCSLAAALENYVLYLVLNTYSQGQQDQLNNLMTNYFLTIEKFPHLHKVIKNFLSKEVVTTKVDDYGLGRTELLTNQYAADNLKAFQKQLYQHNLRVVEKYYTRISLPRLAQLLGASKEVTENELCEMINKKLVYARIDRVKEVIDFRQKKNENEVLNDWNNDIWKLLDLVDSTCNLIKRDEEAIA
jgi:26S proteasome regulatory subunit N5